MKYRCSSLRSNVMWCDESLETTTRKKKKRKKKKRRRPRLILLPRLLLLLLIFFPVEKKKEEKTIASFFLLHPSTFTYSIEESIIFSWLYEYDRSSRIHFCLFQPWRIFIKHYRGTDEGFSSFFCSNEKLDKSCCFFFNVELVFQSQCSIDHRLASGASWNNALAK